MPRGVLENSRSRRRSLSRRERPTRHGGHRTLPLRRFRPFSEPLAALTI